MKVDLGMDVFGSNGEKVGTVERIVVDSNTMQIHKLIVGGGFLNTDDRLVDIEMVTGQDANGLRLNLTSEQVDQLPEYVEERFVQVPERDYDALPFIIPNAMGAGAYLYGAPYVGRGYEGSRDSFFDAAPAVAPVVETETNIPETDIMIAEGTDVFGADGEKIGSVGDVIVADDGAITGFVVSAGFIFKHKVRVPIDVVESANEDEIRLSVTSAEAESAGFDIEDSTL